MCIDFQYHPYGARHSNSSLTKANGNRWRFSGKEEFDDAFGLPQSDFGARFYDRAAWSSLDPLAEKYYSLSPYAFCAGNPIIFVDRDGKRVFFAPNSSEKFKQQFAEVVQFMNEKRTSYNLAKLEASDKIYYIEERIVITTIETEAAIRHGEIMPGCQARYSYSLKTFHNTPLLPECRLLTISSISRRGRHLQVRPSRFSSGSSLLQESPYRGCSPRSCRGLCTDIPKESGED